MLAAGMLIIWGGYSVSLWGWCLLQGYNVTLGQLMSPVHPYGSGKGQAWPPALMGPDVIFPGGRSGSSSGSQGAAAAPGPKKKGSGRGAPTGFTGSTVKPYG